MGGLFKEIFFPLFGVVAFVLLIACANVANLLLARNSTRGTEMAMRASLGAGQFRILRQLLTESVLLGLLGGLFSLVVVDWGIKLFVALAPQGFPHAQEIKIDGRVLGFTFACALLTGIVFGLTPAVRASRPDLLESLKEGSRSLAMGSRHIARNILVITEVSLALVAYQFEWDWTTAEKEFKRALELDPSSSSTYEPSPSSTSHWYSHYLQTMGRMQESFRASRRALELDPLDLANNSHQGWHYILIHQYDRAMEPLQKTIELAPSFHIAQWYLGLVYEQKGAFQDAISQFRNCVRITGGRPSMVALLGHAHAAANQRSEAQEILQQLSAKSKQEYVPSYPVAAIYAALGQKDEAFAWLQKAYDERGSWMNYLGLDPRLEGLRSDPRFAVLLRRMNLGS
jgi:Flp pilus assembly protein TadD